MKVEVEFMYDVDHDRWETEQVMISEDDLPLLTKDDMRALRITPNALKEVFAEARELAKDIKPSDRVRIIADRIWRGRGEHYRGRSKEDFLVAPCRYSPLSDPMLQEVEGDVQSTTKPKSNREVKQGSLSSQCCLTCRSFPCIL
jgi:hypothetical protein